MLDGETSDHGASGDESLRYLEIRDVKARSESMSGGDNPGQFQIVEDRYDAGSTLITSQLAIDTWHDVIGEPTFADAILDRLVHNACRLTLGGQSMRKTKAKTVDETPIN